jgi:hypothetical protein
MIINDNFGISYDLSGNLVITIPKSSFQSLNLSFILESVEKKIKLAIKTVYKSEGWKNDSASDLVGICKSEIHNGSTHHDQYIYGL